MSKLPWMLIAAGMIGCINNTIEHPVKTAGTGNNVTVEELFEYPEGCHVYRFRDFHQHYYVVCGDGRSAETDAVLQDGKHIRQDPIPTVSVPCRQTKSK